MFSYRVGTAGRDTMGVIRVFQFYKLRQLVFCLPEESESWHLQCIENEERMLQALEIPYRVIICSSDETAAPGSMKYDIEAWMPSQQRHRQVTSNTNLTDYQIRRGEIRFKDAEHERICPHTISATGISDRHILAVMENHQMVTGSIEIPTALRPLMGGRQEIHQ